MKTKAFPLAIAVALVLLAVVTTPGCGVCWGYIGHLSEDEVCVTTTQQTYRGRMGSYEADIYLASPYTVAASAVKGIINDPRELLKG